MSPVILFRLSIETMRSDAVVSSSNRTSVAVQPPSTESNADNSNLEEKQ